MSFKIKFFEATRLMPQKFSSDLPITSIYTVFNAVHGMSVTNVIRKFHDIQRIFLRVRVSTDRQTECINTFQLCRKMLKNSILKIYIVH